MTITTTKHDAGYSVIHIQDLVLPVVLEEDAEVVVTGNVEVEAADPTTNTAETIRLNLDRVVDVCGGHRIDADKYEIELYWAVMEHLEKIGCEL